MKFAFQGLIRKQLICSVMEKILLKATEADGDNFIPLSVRIDLSHSEKECRSNDISLRFVEFSNVRNCD